MNDPRFAPVVDLLESFAAEDPDYSAQLCVYAGGVEVIDHVVGPNSTADSLTGVFSASKGAAGMVIALLVQDGLLDPGEPVATYWPEFAANGKARITVGQLLSHQGGLPGLDGGLTVDQYTDSATGAVRLAAAPPVWKPGTTHQYHALTLGVFAEELVRRITGETLQQVYETRIRAPFGIDFHLGLPDAQEPRYREVLKPLQSPPMPFIDPFGPMGLALNSTGGFDVGDGQAYELLDLPNLRQIRSSGIAAAGGVASARGLARLYAAASTGVVREDGAADGPFLTGETIRTVADERVFGIDRANGLTGAFGLMFMKSIPRNDFGSWRAFGHDGANATLAYADPAYGVGFGYVPARAEESGTASRGGQLSATLRRALLSAAAD
ncbi:serine hydrolase domain-containing protein [Arthrobacter sp.]|uniref:serine hydrolase domain-containing protein n=1 Tax=Arthrobacter sp. TaxID=1667 RepID=UPI003A914D91